METTSSVAANEQSIAQSTRTVLYSSGGGDLAVAAYGSAKKADSNKLEYKLKPATINNISNTSNK